MHNYYKQHQNNNYSIVKFLCNKTMDDEKLEKKQKKKLYALKQFSITDKTMTLHNHYYKRIKNNNINV